MFDVGETITRDDRRSGFSIGLARARPWSGLADGAFESPRVARHIAPQHTGAPPRWLG